MTGRLPILLVVLAFAGPALAEHQVENIFPLPHVAKAIAGKHLHILVLGAGSSLLPGGIGEAYPARLQRALTEKLPGVEIKLATDVKPKRTAVEMVKAL